MQPAQYPAQALYYIAVNSDVLQFLIKLFFTELTVPVFWIFRSLVKKHHRQVFQFVLRQNGLSPDKIVPLTAADHKELQVLMQQIQTEKRQKQEQHPTVSTQNPAIEWLIWIVKPPSLSSGRVEYVVKRLLTAPFRSALPFLTVLFGAANSHTQARDALAPYLEMKGVSNPDEQDALVVKHKLMFYQFGWAALIFSCIPIVGAFLAFTNTVGAALWAIDLEKQHFNLMSDDRKKIS